MKKKKKLQFNIVIDTREQKPYNFSSSITKCLNAGDYSIETLEDKIAIERKTKEDVFASMGQGRKRFEREMERLSKYDYAALVIESSLSNLLTPSSFTKMNPKSVINSLISWSIKYKIFVFLSENREYARAVTYRILEKYWKIYHERRREDGL